MKKLLLLSNSTNKGEGFLDYPKAEIKAFLGNQIIKVLFIPYAAVTFTYDEYEMLIADKFEKMGYDVASIHKYKNKKKAVNKAEAIVIGGGNTFMLLYNLQEKGLLKLIRKRIIQGIPYIGWSAGANIACPTIRTTNDMPVIAPKSLNALNLVPFQINPHYTHEIPKDFAGETRDMRLREFTHVNHNVYVVGLREGTMLEIKDNLVKFLGKKQVRIFINSKDPEEFGADDNLNFLMGK